MEQHDLDADLGRSLGGGERLGCAEVVELTDRRVAGGAHLPIHLGVPQSRTESGVARSASSSMPSRHVQKSVPAALPRRAR